MRRKVSKSEFIASQPETLSAAEVVEKAKAAGIKLSANYVHAVRSKRRASTSRVEKAISPGPAKARPSVEDVLRAAAAEIGIGKAMAILEGDRAVVRKLTGTE